MSQRRQAPVEQHYKGVEQMTSAQKPPFRWVVAFFDASSGVPEIHAFPTKKDALQAKWEWERVWSSDLAVKVYRVDSATVVNR